MPFTRSHKGSSRQEETLQFVTEESAGATTEGGTMSGTTARDTCPLAPAGEYSEEENQGDKDLKINRGTSKEVNSPKSSRRERLASLAKKRKDAALEVARKELALAKAYQESLQDDDDDATVISELPDQEDNVERWVNNTVERISEREAMVKDREVPPIKPQDPAVVRVVQDVSDAIIKAIKTSAREATVPSYMHELPRFDGDINEWLAFKTVYEDTAQLFSKIQNMTRLRKAIAGEARRTIKSLLYSDTAPEDIIEALRRRFGRSDTLVLAEMDKLSALPRITEDARDVCVFASEINNIVATIKSLKKLQYLQDPKMIKTIVEKMPAVLRYRWFDFVAHIEDPDMVHLGKFLNREADQCSPYITQPTPTRKPQGAKREVAHAAIRQEEENCAHCQGSHRLLECKKFMEAPIKERWEIALKSKLCFKCLNGRHRKQHCKKPRCKVCNRWHHVLLHGDRLPEQKSSVETTNNVLQVNTARTTRAYLKMVPVELYGPKGTVRVLALLDEGSTVTLLDTSVANQLGLHGAKEALTIETVGGKLITKRDSIRIMEMKLRGIHQNRRKTIRGTRTIDDLRLTPQKMDKNKLEGYPHLSELIEHLYYEEEQPKLLIGQDNWDLIISRSTRKGKKNQPVASLTHLGWVLHGCDSGSAKEVNFVTCAHISAREEEWDKMIKEHFAIESLGIQPRQPSTDSEARALEILEKTAQRRDDGRFEVGLIWRKEASEMPDNYKFAENRLRGIEKKLDKDEGLKEEYERQIQNLLQSGYAEEAPKTSTSTKKWYLPHFAVTHPSKDKKRLVFDAAAKFAGRSLNDMLLPGPDLLQSLFGVLLRFRQHPVAVVADIKEMFLQIKIREEDRDSLRFLWRGEARTEKPKEYRMTSVIFGATCSPSTAIYIKNRNAEELQDRYPAAVRAVKRNHYMDDYLHSLPTESEVIQTASEVAAIHRRAGFELRGWASNSSTVLQRLTRGIDANLEVELGSKEEKTLGLKWFTEEDEIGFRTCLRNVREVVKQQGTPTKREVTSAVMSTFDPMGLASPVLIQGKKLLQNIWRSGVGWDDEVEPVNDVEWKRYMKDLQQLKELRIPRCVRHSSHEGELHIFTDASETAYACAVYWRQENGQGQFDVTLLAGKARVAPLKPISIPRLELQAAVLGTRMAHSIEKEMDVKPIRKMYWTDSSTVLGWIKTDPRTFKPFVAHRLAEIEDTSKPQEWRWVSTKDNPADDATRDVPREFNGRHRWFTGPQFLRETEDAWPTPRSFKGKLTGEEKEALCVAAVMASNKYPTPDPARFSSWNRLCRATARILQFVDLCRRKQQVNLSRKAKREDPTWKKYKKEANKKPEKMALKNERRLLPIEEYHKDLAAKILLKRCQEESFGEEIAAIGKGKLLEKSSKLKKIDVMLDEGLIRLRGRINAAQGVGKNFKQPLVLDSKHFVTRLIIAHYHRLFNHGNHATVINEIRQRFWILGLRAAVRATAHACQWCKVYRKTPLQPPTGDLPKERLCHGEPPFTSSAVDYFGPMTVTVGRRREKRWGALFTCLTTRALHLEIVASLSSNSTILALRRMAARRGMPRSIFSDNGTNFVGANNELKKALEGLQEEEVVAEAEKMGVQWKFIAPGAPNMGGSWERLVRSVKTALEVTLRETHPKEEVLNTLMVEAEHLINSRPLVEKLEDEERESLTPNHFLIGRSCGLPRLGMFCDRDLTGRREWKIAERLADHFWARWVKEYLPTLIPRKIDGKATSHDLQRGDVVMIVDASLPRGFWPKGEIIRTYPGPDGKVRIIEVRTNGGILKRPSSRAVLLVPAQNKDATQDAPTSSEVESSVVTCKIDGAAHEGETVGDDRLV